MKISFRREHKSILSFPTTEIPPEFVVITGVNGAGKTHLLEAIENGSVQVEGIAQGQPQIRRFHHTTMQPNDAGAVNPTQLWNQRGNLWSELEESITRKKNEIRSYLMQQGIASEFIEDTSEVSKWTVPRIKEFVGNEDKAVAIHGYLATWREDAKSDVLKKWVNNRNRTGLAAVLQDKCPDILSLTRARFAELMPMSWNPVDVFQQNFAALFAMYHRHWEKNRINRYYSEQEGENRIWVTDEDFVKEHGGPPWKTVNRILAEAKLPLRVNWPTGDYDQDFTLTLSHTEHQRDVAYSNLSSGEKIIISLAHCLYYATSGNPSLTLPKLLLLDEPDAPLHPSMARDFMRVIEKVLVREKGVKVIMTTHSPSTVAFAPDESIYRLEALPRKLSRCNKDAAVSVLTDGFMTVLASPRFVIVESKFDESTYQMIFDAVHQSESWPSVPGLVFVRASDGDNRSGGGCDQVANWAEKLSSLGLPMFRGLRDHDTGATPVERVRLLGRYSIENYLLDPIIIYACLVEKDMHSSILDVDEINNCNVHNVVQLPADRLQEIANAIFQKLEEFRPALKKSDETFVVEYVNGSQIKAPTWLRDSRGHDLQTCVRECFRGDGNHIFSRNPDECALMLAAKLSDFVPKDLYDLFVDLAS